jgi:hypothetical protein
VPGSPPPFDYLRRQAVFRALYGAAHVGFEVPFGPGTWIAGFRTEYAYNWSGNIAPGHDGSLGDVNLLFTTGYRY